MNNKAITLLVQSLIKEGAEVNSPLTDGLYEGFTPLHWAAYAGKLGTVQALLEAGAEVTATVTDGLDKGKTPLHFAVENGHTEIVEALIKAGADVKATVTDGYYKGYTPLHLATENGHTDTVRILLDNRADPTVTDSNGDTPLNTAQRNGQSEVAAILARKNHPTEIQFQFHLDEINSMWHTGYFNVIEPWGRMESITGDDDMTDHICQYLTAYNGGCSWLWCDSYLEAKIILEYFKKDLLVTGFILRDTARIGPDFSSGTWGHVVWLNVDISKTLKTPTKGKRRSLDEAISSRKSGVPL